MDQELKAQELYEYMIDYGIATEDEIALVMYINGDNLGTLEDILYVRTGYRSLDQIKEDEDEEE